VDAYQADCPEGVLMLIVNQKDEWTIYFNQPEGAYCFTEPTRVSLYSYRSAESLQAFFLPDSEGRAPSAIRIRIFENHYYAPTRDGVYLTDACYRGISETLADMNARGTLRTFFRPGPPPLSRWSALSLRELTLPAAVEEFRTALTEQYANGSTIVALYEANDPTEFRACLRLQPIISPLFQWELLRNPALTSLAVFDSENYEIVACANWNREGPFHLSASFASALYYGGAYGSMRPDYERALRLAQAARDSLWGNNYDSLYAWSCYDSWSGWFHDVAWDWTFLAIDLGTARIACLFATDTD
jgi:hypothetical protein